MSPDPLDRALRRRRTDSEILEELLAVHHAGGRTADMSGGLRRLWTHALIRQYEAAGVGNAAETGVTLPPVHLTMSQVETGGAMPLGCRAAYSGRTPNCNWMRWPSGRLRGALGHPWTPRTHLSRFAVCCYATVAVPD